MAKQKGRAFLLRIGDGETPTEVFTPFAGLTAKSLTISNEQIDVTTHGIDPTSKIWRETLDGVSAINISGDFMLSEDAPEATLVAAANSADQQANFEIFIPTIGTYSGRFFIAELSFSAEGAVSGALSLQSTGAIAFDPAV